MANEISAITTVEIPERKEIKKEEPKVETSATTAQPAAANPKDTVQLQEKKEGADNETLAIAQILAESNKSNMPIDKLAEELKNKGFNVQVVEGEGENGKKHSTLQFIDKEGNVTKAFKDTSGDGQIGMQDSDFKAAAEQLEKDPRYTNLVQFLEVKEAEGQAKKKLEEQYENFGLMPAMGSMGQLGELGNTINGQGGAASFEKIDAELVEKGYSGHPCAAELFQMGMLEQVASKYDVRIPQEIYRDATTNPYEKFNQLATLAMLPHIYGQNHMAMAA